MHYLVANEALGTRVHWQGRLTEERWIVGVGMAKSREVPLFRWPVPVLWETETEIRTPEARQGSRWSAGRYRAASPFFG